jgi:hypothetical protein
LSGHGQLDSAAHGHFFRILDVKHAFAAVEFEISKTRESTGAHRNHATCRREAFHRFDLAGKPRNMIFREPADFLVGFQHRV